MMATKEERKSLFANLHINLQQDGSLTVGEVRGVPDISHGGIGEPAAWFLGPRAENGDILSMFIEQALNDVIDSRLNTLSRDPILIDAEIKSSLSYTLALEDMKVAYTQLLRFLRTYSASQFGMHRYGYTLWDNTIPAVAGFFAAMLHNPNSFNVQSTSAAALLGVLVGWDFCQMIGFSSRKEIEPSARITVDGPSAIAEATWVSRECKFLPFAVQALLENQEAIQGRTEDGQLVKKPLEKARELPVVLCDNTVVRLLEADHWQLFNICQDEILNLPGRIRALCGLPDDRAVWKALQPYSLNGMGWQSMYNLNLAQNF